MKFLSRRYLTLILLLLIPVSITAQTGRLKKTKKHIPEQSTNSAPTITPVFKAYCQAKISNNEVAFRRVFSQDTLRSFEAGMKQDKVTSLLKYLENDKVSSKLCGVRNEQIQGDTAIAEIRGDSFPNGLKFIFVKENGEWKMTNRSPEIEALRKSSPNSFANRVTKKNERPTGDNVGDPKTNGRAAYTPVYFYEFTRPGFTYERVLIEHDEAGKGSISFSKDGFDEMMTDPILLAPVTMGNLTTVLTALNFLASNDNYQTESDHSNMGNVTITVKKDGKERMAKYNWTENKQAKFLMDEYRRIANEYTWKFEIGIARQNQPLQTPRLMTTLDDYISRNEISDPPHLVTMLTELSTDERLPLIARDHAAKIVKQIEKAKK